MNELQQEEVHNIAHYNTLKSLLIKKLAQHRKDAGFSQQQVADWLDVDRRKIMELENGKCDFELLLLYADKFSIDVFFSLKHRKCE